MEKVGTINAVMIDRNNPGIERIDDLCVNCGICTQTCVIREGMNFNSDSELCLSCGQCIGTCPTGALRVKDEYDKFLDAHDKGMICIAYVSPAVRVALGDIFGLEYGEFVQDKMVGLLRKLGFDYVFDTTFGADLTIMEEASELQEKFNNGNFPMFTSCCPAWVKYVEQFYPRLVKNISSCKSPISMMGSIIKNYFNDVKKINKDNIYTVAITPCTAKKYEVSRQELNDTDLVLTVRELDKIIKANKIMYDEIENSDFDSIFGCGSGAGVIFGSTGGVSEACLRTVYYLITGKKLDKLEFNNVRGYEGVKEAFIKIGDKNINVCVINGIINAKKILDDIEKGIVNYNFIEVMNCRGGCVGGGGLINVDLLFDEDIRQKRMSALYNRDDSLEIRCSYENPMIVKIYDEYLGKPLSEKAKNILHTNYHDDFKLKDDVYR